MRIQGSGLRTEIVKITLCVKSKEASIQLQLPSGITALSQQKAAFTAHSQRTVQEHCEGVQTVPCCRLEVISCCVRIVMRQSGQGLDFHAIERSLPIDLMLRCR